MINTNVLNFLTIYASKNVQQKAAGTLKMTKDATGRPNGTVVVNQVIQAQQNLPSPHSVDSYHSSLSESSSDRIHPAFPTGEQRNTYNGSASSN